MLGGAATAEAQGWGAGSGKEKKGRYAEVNGIKLYYEIRGSGRPLVLLHGGLGAGEMFGPNLPALAKGRQVIAVDLQGHGRTADIDRPLSVELMADDIAALIKHLELGRADIMGYSLGGGVAMQTAVRHPDVVNKLVLVSTVWKRSGFYPDILAQQGQVTAEAAEMMKDTPMYKLYSAIAPRPQDFPKLLGKIGEAMKKDFDFSKQVAGIKASTLIVAGDADIFPPSHAVEMFGLLGGGQEGSRLGRRGPPATQARHPPRPDPLQHLRRPLAGRHRHQVPRRTPRPRLTYLPRSFPFPLPNPSPLPDSPRRARPGDPEREREHPAFVRVLPPGAPRYFAVAQPMLRQKRLPGPFTSGFPGIPWQGIQSLTARARWTAATSTPLPWRSRGLRGCSHAG